MKTEKQILDMIKQNERYLLEENLPEEAIIINQQWRKALKWVLDSN